ncbi:MAG: hypothetical protein CGW95_15465 [Phenylobacterium zucineum]|nr:MAG: hypothetical protein CGW95_15465 [Phenylobacterium zucineum]
MNKIEARLTRLEGQRAAPRLIVQNEGETPAEALERAFGDGPVLPHYLIWTGVPRALKMNETGWDRMA